MTLHPISAGRLAARLASGKVTAQEQACYLAGTFVLSMLPAYLFITPPLMEMDPQWFYPMWFYELALLIVVNVAGVAYCLGKCYVQPSRHFLVDFSCLNFPILLTTIVVTWALFWAIAFGRFELAHWWMDRYPQDPGSHDWPLYFASARFFDLIRLVAMVGAGFAVFYRTGRHMERVADLRASATGG